MKEVLRTFVSVAFVSGHLDLTEAEFGLHYAPRLHEALRRGDTLVVGDARGCDLLTLLFLDAAFPFGGAPVTVYHMLDAPRQHRWGDELSPYPTADVHPLVGGFASDDARDAALTAASAYDIAWVRPGRERSGTARNLSRRSGSA